MSAGTRIRWRRAAPAAAVVALAGAVIALGPRLLRAPEQPPLPADVGLGTPLADVSAPLALEPPSARRDRQAKAKRPPRPEPERRGRATQPESEAHPRTDDEHPSQASPAPVPTPVSTPPAPAPAPTSYPAAPASPPAPAARSSEFSFER